MERNTKKSTKNPLCLILGIIKIFSYLYIYCTAEENNKSHSEVYITYRKMHK